MLSYFADAIRLFLAKVLQMLGIGTYLNDNLLRIFVKTNLGSVVPVDLEPTWVIKQVKEAVAPQLGVAADELKIIFAGRELHDSVLIEHCDLGDHSVLHAVRIVQQPEREIEVASPVKQLYETVGNLQLSEEERQEVGETKNVHFYVYCSGPCKGMKIGKLRVCCETCRGGAFTVARDPECWADVLEPRRVQGLCEEEGCQGKFATFYFKCGEHVSQGEDDRAVALYLVKSNFMNVSCLACGDISDPVIVFDCKHVICMDCFQMYCETRLNERRFVQTLEFGYTLACPAGCDDSVIKEIHHFKLMGAEQYERYQRFGAEECLLQAGGVLCPQPGCGMGLLPDKECRRVKCENGCGFVFCRQCLDGYHLGECSEMGAGATENLAQSYSIDPTRAAEARWEDASRVTIRVITKPCPNCRTPTERDGGCMHMVCTRPQCRYQWCWMCQTEWTRECMGNHWFG